MSGRRRDRWYIATRDGIADVIRDQGWTCDMHEPDPACEECRRLHLATAEAILEAKR